MNRFRSFIATFFAFLLSAGLLISTLHIHEFLDEHAHPPFDTEHVWEQAHDTCPFCAIVFEGFYHVENSDIYSPGIDEDTPVLTHQVAVQPVLSDKDSRSPPSAG